MIEQRKKWQIKEENMSDQRVDNFKSNRSISQI